MWAWCILGGLDSAFKKMKDEVSVQLKLLPTQRWVKRIHSLFLQTANSHAVSHSVECVVEAIAHVVMHDQVRRINRRRERHDLKHRLIQRREEACEREVHFRSHPPKSVRNLVLDVPRTRLAAETTYAVPVSAHEIVTLPRSPSSLLRKISMG